MRRLVRAISGYFYGGVRRERVEWLVRGFLALFAADVCVNMLAHGWRYGADGFNVPHVPVAAGLLPEISSGLYVGLVAGAGVLSFAVALGAFGRRAVGVAGAAFTAAWLMSMLDSYQHHYLMSLVFVCLLGMPIGESAAGPGASSDRAGDDPPNRPAWGYPLLCVTVAITYAFAAVAKLEPAWQKGAVIRTIVGDEEFWGLAWWQWLGGEPSEFWAWVGPAVVATQMLVAVGYLAAPLADRRGGVAAVVARVGCLVAVGFHLSAEMLDFQIQWFSYYMIGMAVICLGPREPLQWGWRAVESVGDGLWRRASRWASRGERPVLVGMPLALAAAVAVGWIDLPGTGALAVGIGVGAAAWVFGGMWRGRSAGGVRVAAALCVAGVAMAGLVEVVDARYDFYRYAGGDRMRRAPGAEDRRERIEMLEQAARYYRKANRHAPPGDGGREKLHEIEGKLERLRE